MAAVDRSQPSIEHATVDGKSTSITPARTLTNTIQTFPKSSP